MVNPKIQFIKIRNVKSPNRANLNDAGTDFYMPYNSGTFIEDLRIKNEKNDLIYNLKSREILEIGIKPHSQVLIPSGIKVNIIDKNTYLDAENKSGIATKSSLLVGAQVVDSDYTGEIHINLHNISNYIVYIESGQKLIQFIQKEYIHTKWEEISEEEYNNLTKNSDRGSGGFGSSGLQ